MVNRSKDELGVSLFDFGAIVLFSEAGIYERYLKAAEELAARKAEGKVTYAFGPDLHQIAEDNYRFACKAVCSNLKTKIRNGELVLAGYVAGPHGRHPDAPRKRVPDDVLALRNLGIKRLKKKIEGNKLTYFDVRLYTLEEFDEYSSDAFSAIPKASQDADADSVQDDRPHKDAPNKILVKWYIRRQGKTKAQRLKALEKDNVPLTSRSREIRNIFQRPLRSKRENDSGLYIELRKQIAELK